MSGGFRKVLLLVLGIPFVIIGTRFLLDAGEAWMIDRAAASWTPTPMDVLSVDTFTSADQALGNQTVIRYTYDAGGSRHEGQYSCIGDECPGVLMQSVHTAHKTGTPVTGLVDPDKPERSLLYRYLHAPLMLLRIGVGIFCFLTGAAAVIFGVYLLSGHTLQGQKA